jgi:erythromycin esterase
MRTNRTRYAEPDATAELVAEVRTQLRPLYGWEDLDPLIERIGNAHYVLLGEATHGTADFYNWRRTISQQLIQEKGFAFIAVEGDWPDCYRVNRYVKNLPNSGSRARDVLHHFQRWPMWLWANEELISLVEWLRGRNERLPEEQQVGFYGLDVYSLWDSMRAVLEYLENIDDVAAESARRAFECFEPFNYDVQEYAEATAWLPANCEDEVIDLLANMRREEPRYGVDGREAFFNAEQNALVAKNAETYYGTMVRGDAESWNIRDHHMVETLNRLMAHHGPEAKAIVWEHNTHVGDARYTDMAAAEMVNVGQLVREEHATQGVVLVGFSTYRGGVIAGEYWGAPMQRMDVPAAPPGSWEQLLHEAAAGDRLWLFNPTLPIGSPLLEPRGHRAIGVVYRPTHEALGNYVPTVLPHRYDALLYIDESHALRPLHVPASFEHEVPETYPTGI